MADTLQEAFDAVRQQGQPSASPQPQNPAVAPGVSVSFTGGQTSPDASNGGLQAAFDDVIAANRQQQMVDDVAIDTETALGGEPRITVSSPAPGTWMGLWTKASRTATLNLVDYATAASIKWKMKDEIPDLTYSEVLAAVQKDQDENRMIGAEIIGSVLPIAGTARVVGAVAKLGRAARTIDPVVKMGMRNGAVRWAMKDRAISRLVRGAAVGAGAGFVEEGIRVAVDEAIDASYGAGFDGEKVTDAMVQGALVGVIGAPVIGTVARAGAKGLDHVKALFGNKAAQARQAYARILRAARDGKETLQQTHIRLQQDFATFLQKHGRPPTLTELMGAPEKVRDVTDIARFTVGLGDHAARLTRDQLDVVLKDFDRALGGPIKDTSAIRLAANQQFDEVVSLYGNRDVTVPDHVMAALSRNKAWLDKVAGFDNPGARRIMRVVDAQDDISAARERLKRLIRTEDNAANREDVAEIRNAIANLVDRRAAAEDMGADEILQRYLAGESDDLGIARLAHLANTLQKQTSYKAAGTARRNAAQNRLNVQNTVLAMQRELDSYARDGLKMTLSDANMLRKHAGALRDANDDTLAQLSRTLYPLVSEIGTKEVPAYSMAVRNFAKAMTRVEAQDVGVAAMRGSVSPENTRVFVQHGVSPDVNKPNVGANQMGEVMPGTSAGARKELRRQVRDTQSSALTSVQNLEGSRQARDALQEAAPNEARRITEQARAATKSIENLFEGMTGQSPSKLQREVQTWRDLAETGVINRLGGAATASLVMRVMRSALIPRGTARKLIDMMLDPKQSEQAFRYLEDKGVPPWAIYGAVSAAMEGHRGE